MESYNDTEYAQAWKTIDSLEQQGLPKSALEKVEALLVQVRTDNNPAQTIKCLMYRSKYQSQLEESGSVNAILRLEGELKDAKFPVDAVLYSILAEGYTQYLQGNRWQIQNRTNTVSFNNEDIETWTIDQIAQKAMEMYRKSVANPKLRQINIVNFNALTSEQVSDTDHLRPTLFDFLAHRAIDYFTNEQSYLTQPTFRFYLDDEAIFAPAPAFAQKQFASKDTTSGKYNALVLLQELTARHLDSEDPAALIDIELKRLNFAHDNAIVSEKGKLYLEALQQLKTKYDSHPSVTEIMVAMGQYHVNLGSQYVASSGDETYRYELQKAVALYREAIAKFPDSYGAKIAANQKTSIEAKTLMVDCELVNLPNEPFLVKLDIKNVNKAWFRIAAVNEDQIQEINRSSQEDISKILRKLNPIKSWTTEWSDSGDLQNHSIEVKAEPMPLGTYVLIASANADFDLGGNAVAFAFTYVSDIAYWWQQGGNEGGQFVVAHRKTGEALADVEVTFYKSSYNQFKQREEYDKVKTLRSDKNGIVRPMLLDGHTHKVIFKKGNDVLNINEHINDYRNNINPNKESYTEFFLDRKMYRPGQTIYFKALAMEKDLERIPHILANQNIEITFYDVNGQKVDSKQLKTNAFGTVNGTFTAPRSGLLGAMTLRSSVGGNNIDFRVEEYKRPKFEAKIDPLTGSYKLEDDIKVTGLAKAFAGSAIDGAKVSYRVVREVNYPYFPWWRYGYYRMPFRGQSEEIAFGETMTKADGTFDISFKAKADRTADKKNQPVFTYNIYADVVDITGETHSASGSVTIGYVALHADVLLGEQMERDSFKQITISTQNFSGTDEPAKGKVQIKSLQSPNRPYISRYWEAPDLWLMTEKDYETHFPQYAYKAGEKIANWKEKEVVANLDFNTGESKKVDVAKLNLPAGVYFLELTTADKYGTPVVVRKYFKLFDLQNQALPYDDMLFHHLDKSVYEPGETANYYIGSAAKPIFVYHQVEHKGKFQKEEWIKANALQKLTTTLEEKHRGNLNYYLTFVKDNRFFQITNQIVVPFSNKDLTIEMATFRDKLYPGQDEEWQIKISGPKKDKVAAEMVATMYDASLDVFMANGFNNYFYPTFGWQYYVNSSNFRQAYGRVMADWREKYEPYPSRNYRYLNWFGLYFGSGYYREVLFDMVTTAGGEPKRSDRARNKSEGAPPPGAPQKDMAQNAMAEEAMDDANTQKPKDMDKAPSADGAGLGDIAVRTNLNETVFFLPELKTDEEGNIIFSFKMNEALTRWKFLGFAHTKDLKTGTITKDVVTQKDLMVMPNAPRFFREGDEIVYTAKVTNMTKAPMDGTAQLALFDAISNQPINDLLGLGKALQPFTAAPGQSALLEWRLKIPYGEVMAVTHRVVAKAGNFSDGEESVIPVLTNRMLVTETMPLPVRGKQSKNFNFTKLAESGNSTTLKHHKYTLEFTSNPAWYAVQALPYMMEYPYQCTEQIFSRYYANSLATSVANAHPKVKTIFEKWKNTDAMKSNLTKNQELKSALLEETPWVLAAQTEEQQKQNIGLLFDLKRMSDEQEQAIATLLERQDANGGFAWFPGGRDSWYITQYIVEGMGHLDALGVKSVSQNPKDKQIIDRAVNYIDLRLNQQYEELAKAVAKGNAKWEEDHLDYMAIHYLYARSFFLDIGYQFTNEKVVNYYLGQAKKYWTAKNIYAQGMLALALHRNKDKSTTDSMVKSFKERALNNDELGMYWKYDRGYFWYNLPIETHSLMIEVFDEVANDEKSVDDLKVWLLKNKQTNNWKTTKATSAAVYALLRRGGNWLLEDQPVKITMGGKKLDVNPSEMEAGTGYFKKAWDSKMVNSEMAKVTVENPNSVVAWGAVYWQYFEDLDKITTFEETPLTLKKQLFKETNTARGPVIEPVSVTEVLQPGDKLKVRIELRVDRAMEYVHMKDMRASGFEPINVLSQYKWQDGLGYYESTRDASTNFFIDYLPKGTYVFEYPLRVNHKGNFSNGVTTIQCMYAPEFTSHSEGVRVKVD
jgi:uncharacterized protein YfaS (alpha-2-macroglobulin family)